MWLAGLHARPHPAHQFAHQFPNAPPQHAVRLPTLPCRGARRDATFENVLKKGLAFPEGVSVSPACKDLIGKLLNKARWPAGACWGLLGLRLMWRRGCGAVARGRGAPLPPQCSCRAVAAANTQATRWLHAVLPPLGACPPPNPSSLPVPPPAPLQEPSKRLGSRAGADEIKRHPWFAGINWALVRHSAPPFILPRRSSVGGEPAGSRGGSCLAPHCMRSRCSCGPRSGGGWPCRASLGHPQ